MAKAIELTKIRRHERVALAAWADALYYIVRPAARLVGRGQWLALNGQRLRAAVVERLLGAYHPEAVVETGTSWGSSTLFFAEHADEVFTCEISSRRHFVARLRLRASPNATLLLGGSTDGLQWIAQGPGANWARPFFYLDAHSLPPLPLRFELEFVWQTWPTSVVVVDDCRVPHDPGFGYDDYGGGEQIDLDYMRPPREVRGFFPAHAASDETGFRRGTCYLGRGTAAISCLNDAVRGGFLSEAAHVDP